MFSIKFTKDDLQIIELSLRFYLSNLSKDEQVEKLIDKISEVNK